MLLLQIKPKFEYYSIMLFHDSLSFRHISLCITFYAHFKFHNQISTMTETNTDLDNVQVYAQCCYFIVPVVWYPIDYAKKVNICATKCHSQS